MSYSMMTVQALLRSAILLAVVGTGTHSQSSGVDYGVFNDFINSNSIINNTTTDLSSASGVGGSDVPASGAGRQEDLLYQMRQRSRNQRREMLRYQILSRLGMLRPPSVAISPDEMSSLRGQFPALAAPLPRTTEYRRCYSASCDTPHKVNAGLWNSTGSRGLKLYVPIPRDRTIQDRLRSATVNLFLIPSAARRSPCAAGGWDEEGGSACPVVTGFLVSVYQFLKPLSIRRRGRVVNRRRLLDAKFVPASGNEWITLNIGNVAMEWRRHRKNFGIEVTVKDDNETEVDANSMFVPPNCTAGREIGCREDTGSQFPWSLGGYTDKFPYVDLETVSQQRRSRSSRTAQSSRRTKRRAAVPSSTRRSSEESHQPRSLRASPSSTRSTGPASVS